MIDIDAAAVVIVVAFIGGVLGGHWANGPWRKLARRLAR